MKVLNVLALRIFLLIGLIPLAVVLAPAKDGRDFAGLLQVSNVRQQGNGEVLKLTLSLRLLNFSGADVSHAEVRIEQSLAPGKDIVVFSQVSVADHGNVVLAKEVTVPRRERDLWQRGATPRAFVQYRDGSGKPLRRPVELLLMPGPGQSDAKVSADLAMDFAASPEQFSAGVSYSRERFSEGLSALSAASGIITTYAGGGLPNNVPAVSTGVGYPFGVAVDASGNFFFSSPYQSLVFKVDVSGLLTVAAGNGSYGFSGDGGPATSASVACPYGVAVDGSGNLFVSDPCYGRIRRVDAATGIITTVAGNGGYGFSGDGGSATDASLYCPYGVAVDPSGNLLVADTCNQRIRRVDAGTRIITTVAGNGGYGFSGDGGAATSASLYYPYGVAVDGSGNLFIADYLNFRVRRVDGPTGIISTVAGNGSYTFGGDGGAATSAGVGCPFSVAVDGSGNLFIGDLCNNRVRRMDGATGIISTAAGNGSYGFNGDGITATSASLYYPYGVAVDRSGNLFIADFYNLRIRRVDASTTIISTVAGNGAFRFFGDGGLATSAGLSYPWAVAVDTSGNLFIADTGDGRVRRVDAATHIITTVAGGGGTFGDSGAAVNAALGCPTGVAVDGAGNLFISDPCYNRVRRVDGATGIITTLAGNGAYGFNGDGIAAASASLYYPYGMAVDRSGNVFIADFYNYRIRRVDAATGIITTVAGNGDYGFSGDGGSATSASLSSTIGVAVDTSGNLFIDDLYNLRIRRVDAATGIITTVAGNGGYGFSGDGGAATSASLYYPYGVTVDRSGNLFIADEANQRIRRVDAATGIITTVAGNGSYGFSGDGGPATDASLACPTGVAVDGSGSLFIADQCNHRIRRVTSTASTTLSVASASGTYGGTTTLSATLTSGGSGVPGMTVTFSLNNASAGSATTDSNGVAALTGALLGGINAGSYPAGVAASFTGAAGFEASSGTAALTVNLASLTIAANSKTRLYGAANPPFDAGYSGFVSSEGPSVLMGTLSCTTLATVSSPAGSYPITCSGQSSSNYTVTYVDGTLTVSAAPLMVTADNATKLYGAPLPAFSASYSAFVNGDTPASLGGTLTFSTTATAASPVGSYPITPGGLTSANYTITFLDGTLSVTPAPLTVSANNASKLYGAPLPAFSASYSAFVNGDTSASLGGTLTFSTAATAASPVGSYPITPGGLTSSNYAITFANGTLTIIPAPTTSTAAAAPAQYSDPTTFTATLSPAEVNGQAPATSVTFFLGSQNMGTVDLSAGGGVLSGTLPTPPLGLAPGNYQVSAAFNGVNSNFSVSAAQTILTITQEDARATYTGALFASTSSATSSTATVTLSATIQDISAVTSDPATDSYPGDIRNATVTFVNRDNNNAVLCTAAVGLVSLSDTKTGTATCNWSANIGSASSVSYTVGVLVGGYYTRNSSADDTVVTVSLPLNNFITGGGYLVLQNSAGQTAGDSGSRNNFGFNVKYNRSNTNLQGNINAIVRSGGRVYQMKGNAMTSLAVNTSNGTATFNGKASIQDITDPLNPISVDGNATLQVTMTDKGEPGSSDTIGITVWNKSGGLWFSSNWTGTKTVEQLLAGGNLVVH